MTLNAEYIYIENSSITQKKKETKIYPMGEKIFKKKCNQDIDLSKYLNIKELQISITKNQLCKPLKDRYFEALLLYLWEVKRVDKQSAITEKIVVGEKDRCPVCGMFVYKYPKWVAQIVNGDSRISFDGVKDLMKYYFEQSDEKIKILVTDYYSQNTIDAKNAYFVIGSDIYGPMGEELIPFESENDAKTFYKDHYAKKIVKYNEITKTQVHKLDE